MNLNYKFTIKYEVMEKQHGETRKKQWSTKRLKREETRNDEALDHLVARVKNKAMKQQECFLVTDKRAGKTKKVDFELELKVGPLNIGKLSGKGGENIKALQAKGNDKGQLRIDLPEKGRGYEKCAVKGDHSVVVHWKYYLEYMYGTKRYWQYPQHAAFGRSGAINPMNGDKLHTDVNCDVDILD